MLYLKRKMMGFSCPQGGSGGGSSGGGSSTSVTSSELPPELRPLASAYTNKAIGLSDKPYQPYTGQRYADLNGVQQIGLGMTTNRALNGSQTMNNAESNLNQMMSGGQNPYLDGMVNQAMDKTRGQINNQFSGSNYGTTAHQGTLTEGLGNVATQMYGGAYDNDQNRRLSAIGQAPTFGNAAYNDASQLMNAGQVMQDQTQQNLDFGYQQFSEAQNQPYKNLAAMAGVFQTPGFGGSQKTETQQSGGGGGGK